MDPNNFSYGYGGFMPAPMAARMQAQAVTAASPATGDSNGCGHDGSTSPPMRIGENGTEANPTSSSSYGAYSHHHQLPQSELANHPGTAGHSQGKTLNAFDISFCQSKRKRTI